MVRNINFFQTEQIYNNILSCSLIYICYFHDLQGEILPTQSLLHNPTKNKSYSAKQSILSRSFI